MIHKSDGREIRLSSLHHAVSCIPTIAMLLIAIIINTQISNSYSVDYMNDQIQAAYIAKLQ